MSRLDYLFAINDGRQLPLEVIASMLVYSNAFPARNIFVNIDPALG